MAHTFDHETSGRRITAYTDFLMAAYDTDADGLADIANVSRDDMAEYVATTDYDDINVAVLSNLGNLTGISFNWLFAEPIGKGARNNADERPTIDHDDMREATVKVKACAAVMAALYLGDAGRAVYDTDMFEVLSGLLHEAARYFDGVLETL